MKSITMHGNMNVMYVAVIRPKCTVVLNDCSTNLYLMTRLECATFKFSIKVGEVPSNTTVVNKHIML